MSHRVPSNSIEWFPCFNFPHLRWILCFVWTAQLIIPFGSEIKPKCHFFSSIPPPKKKNKNKQTHSHTTISKFFAPTLLHPEKKKEGSPDLNLPAENPCHRNFAQSPDVTDGESWGDDSVKLSGMKNCHGSIRTTSNKGPHIHWRKTWQYLRCILVPKIPKILIDSEDLYRWTTKIRRIRMK